tara:strand:+ start:624 stop:842 length:219 start_codon:yes stop_codon:yes gene_type:complete
MPIVCIKAYIVAALFRLLQLDNSGEQDYKDELAINSASSFDKSSFAGDSWDPVHKLLSCWFFSQEVAGNIAT